MTDHEKRLMRSAAAEVRHLRAQVGQLQSVSFVVEAFHAALLGPPRGGSATIDVAWEIERHLADVEKAEQPEGDVS